MASLPPKPNIPSPGQNSQHRRADNRIFVRFPEAHLGCKHHIHTVIAALLNKLGTERGAWFIYVTDHAPTKLDSLDGQEIKITEESAREEAKAEAEAFTGLVPTRFSRSKKTLANPGPTGTLVASFTKYTHLLKLISTSSSARQITKLPKPKQCPYFEAFITQDIIKYVV
ncbi:hypothetical protein EPUL_004960 [Erysiphe pulchra]|uniref:Uncharacterized protein n=1 Tax=Erysiphe pulchra TaxID=225359 RepID=A0A2S4PP69_9PEZI|nr:hypothetical protein EPUL_004960 [Erysiphe pulchra]